MLEEGQTHTEVRRRTEEALLLSEAIKSAILESALDCIVTIDHHGHILDFNPAAETTFGFKREEAVGREMAELIIPPRFREQHRNGLLRAVSSGKDTIVGHRIEITALRKNGDEFPVELAITRIGTQGPPIFTGHIRDITERKQAERQLQESREFFSSIVRSVSEAIFRRSLDYGLLFVNDEYLRMFGYDTMEELEKLSPESLYADPKHRELALCLIAEKGAFRNQEIAYRRKDGSLFWGLTSATTVRDPASNKMLYFDGAIVDITERKNAEQRQAAQYAVTRVLADASTLQEAAPQILRAVCEGLKWDLGMLWSIKHGGLLLQCVDVWHPPQAKVKAFASATSKMSFEPGSGLPGRIWARREAEWVPDVTKDPNFPRAPLAVRSGLHSAFGFPIRIGEQILGVIEFFSHEIREPDKPILELFATIGSQIGQFIERKAGEEAIRKLNADLERRVVDATAGLRNSQNELQQALKQEREYSRLKTNFVTLVSHEFRTPLGVILSSAEILETYFERLKPEQRKEHLQDVQSAAKHMGELMEQVLLLGKVEAGRVEYRPEPIRLKELCQQMVEEILTATNRVCPIQFTDQRLPASAIGDAGLIRHILTNLLSNAVKYSPAGTPVQLKAEREKENVVFHVSDRGIGIPKDDLKRLFESFYRASNVGQIPGTGLGMVLVKRCVELHAGEINVESEAGRGTTVSVSLPLFKK